MNNYPWFHKQEVGPFFLNENEWKFTETETTFQIPQRHIQHIRKALRIKKETIFWVTNGTDLAKKYLLKSNDNVENQKESFEITENKTIFSIMVPAINKKRLELLIQKSVELGTDGFYFIQSDRANYKPPSLERLRLLAENAMYQSKNPRMPFFKFMPNSIFEVNLKEDKLILWGDYHSSEKIEHLIKKTPKKEIMFILGPEGGWSIAEREYLKNNFHSISLSENVLRVETAALCAAYHVKKLIRHIHES